MSNALATILSDAVRTGDLTALRSAVALDGTLVKTWFDYTFTIDMGSDGCWSKDCDASMSISKLLSDGISVPGNRAYSFQFVKVS